MAFNSIGWKSSNILFNALDALLGDPLISGRVRRREHAVRRAGLDPEHDGRRRRRRRRCGGAGGAAHRDRRQRGRRGRTSWTRCSRTGCGDHGRIRRRRARRRTRSTRCATRVHRVHRCGRDRRRGRRRDRLRLRRGGPRGARHRGAEGDRRRTPRRGSRRRSRDLLPNDNDYTTKSGTREITKGSARAGRPTGGTRHRRPRVRVQGPEPATLDLGAGELHRHRALDGSHASRRTIADFYPNIGNLTKSDARAIGILVVMNDLRAASEAYLDNAIVDAGGSVTVKAEESAQLLSEATEHRRGVGRLVLRHRHRAGDQRPGRDERRARRRRPRRSPTAT